nr:HAMP domain-containing methyl-accepting chemotaxis protein [Sedimentibacter sp.]
MMWFYNLKMSKKLLLGFLVVAIVSGMVGVVGIFTIHGLSTDYSDVYVKYGVALDNMSELQLLADNLTLKSNRAIVIMIVIMIFSMLVALYISLKYARIITSPIKRMVILAEKLSHGEVNIGTDGKSTNEKRALIKSTDEIGSLIAAFDGMIENIRSQALIVEKIASGDLTVDVDVRSDKDLLGKKLFELVQKNNEILSNIELAAEQVAAGSRQISDSSISLSQGATEQASSIEELTASIEEIDLQTKRNADYANQANELSERTKLNAIQGNNQMKEMLNAMDEINISSSNISRVIKVIDDIAFQTNILALNAAVEAARAGQHGKGFAVVAEEVRNLAARSAEAAKETTVMIEGSIKKAEVGTQIANETASALNGIVEDITKAASLVNDIAVASNEQASGISQINQGIMQVSVVVQTNSATSEESAAASEELSSQAELLKEQIEKFKLKKVLNLNT